MTIKVAVRHTTGYHYDRLVALGPQLIRLRPAAHCRTPVLAYQMTVAPEKHFINWQQDPFGNLVARVVFPERVRSFSIDIELIAEMTVINPFDFFVEESADQFPFDYDESLRNQLSPYLGVEGDEPLLREYVASIDRSPRNTVQFLVDINRALQQRIAYSIRLEPGVQSASETLERGVGSCRDSAWLLVGILRHLGLAARFVSGYLVQLKADTSPIDGPSGPEADFTDLHAWTEVFVPGAGWIGLDPTSGLFAGEGHIPLACTPEPASAAAVSGAVDKCETRFSYKNHVQRIEETPRVTLPLTPLEWQVVNELGQRVDQELERMDVRLTQGGEPTFVAIDDFDSPQWNTAALGEEKMERARDLLRRLAARIGSGALLHYGQGKWYPGEPLPRWAFSCFSRRDGQPLWLREELIDPESRLAVGAINEDALAFAQRLVERLGVDRTAIMPAYENVLHWIDMEAALPVDVDPLSADLRDGEERKRLAELLKLGLQQVAGFAIPLVWSGERNSWFARAWPMRCNRLILLPGTSPMGYRLPLGSIPRAARNEVAATDTFIEHGRLSPRTTLREQLELAAAAREPSLGDEETLPPATALCLEIRDGRLHLFLPPLQQLEHWIALIAAIESVADELGRPIVLEGYEPPHDPRLQRFSITPDPGVIEVNIAPASSWHELVAGIESLYHEAREARLATEKFMLDGRHTGTGGGNHVTLGGATAADSPFLRRPDLLASLLLFWQHHPALSYLFSGLFVGPTSQAPRIDEARHDTLYELEIALQQLEDEREVSPWLVDRLFRNILIDVTGNTHRAEFCIDKLYNPSGPAGRLGLLEFRAFEMPPHWQMSALQMLLLRALVATFWQQPYRGSPVRWGTELHDRFLLPWYLEQDLGQVLDFLRRAGYHFDPFWFRSFLSFRFPRYGESRIGDVDLELHGAIEPWHVMGEENTSQGTARFVDASVERIQVTVRQFAIDRYALACNGRMVPLQATRVAGQYVAGVRFKAWQPAFGLHPLLPAMSKLIFDVVDLENRRSIGGCTYHVAHPGGRNYETFPVNANEAEARRIARFWSHGHTPGGVSLEFEQPNPEFPCTLDLRYRERHRP